MNATRSGDVNVAFSVGRDGLFEKVIPRVFFTLFLRRFGIDTMEVETAFAFRRGFRNAARVNRIRHR